VSAAPIAPVAARPQRIYTYPRQLSEARNYRRALHAYLRAGGTVAEIARATGIPRTEIVRLLDGRVGLIPWALARRLETLLSERAVTYVRESPTFMLQPGEVPCALLVPLIEDAFEHYGQIAVGQMVGRQVRTLARILRETNGVSFALADRIVTGIAGPSLWLEPPWRRWYHSPGSVLRRASSRPIRTGSSGSRAPGPRL
jgi:hypothetical protein